MKKKGSVSVPKTIRETKESKEPVKKKNVKIISSDEDSDKEGDSSSIFTLRGINTEKLDQEYITPILLDKGRSGKVSKLLKKKETVDDMMNKFSKMRLSTLSITPDDKIAGGNVMKTNLFYVMKDESDNWLPMVPKAGMCCRNCKDLLSNVLKKGERPLGCPYKYHSGKLKTVYRSEYRGDVKTGKQSEIQESVDIKSYTPLEIRKKRLTDKIREKHNVEKKDPDGKTIEEYFDTLYQFCSVPCILRFISDHSLIDKRLRESVTMLRMMCKRLGLHMAPKKSVLDIVNKIGCAPPLDMLFCFGGPMSYSEYHKSTVEGLSIVFSEPSSLLPSKEPISDDSIGHGIYKQKEIRDKTEKQFIELEEERMKKRKEQQDNADEGEEDEEGDEEEIKVKVKSKAKTKVKSKSKVDKNKEEKIIELSDSEEEKGTTRRKIMRASSIIVEQRELD